MNKKKIKKFIVKHKLCFSISAVLILATAIFLLVNSRGSLIEIKNHGADLFSNRKLPLGEEAKNRSPLSGLSCANFKRRPLAVVMANDPIARPLAGISEADLVLEMPVITGDITRIIAFFVCNSPQEIGALRSARHDFIPLVMGFDAILIHWGGSHFALDKLKTDVMDNLDAMTNPFNIFYRDNNRPAPNNGFVSTDGLISASQKLGYRLENEFVGYDFETSKPQMASSGKKLIIKYNYPYNVEYHYKAESNSYLRWRAGIKEKDENTKTQVEVKNIVVMRAFSRQIEDQYNDLDIEGSGECQIYKNGEVIDCEWQKKKDDPKSKLYFLNKDTQEEIPFVPGQTWIEIVEPEQVVKWE